MNVNMVMGAIARDAARVYMCHGELLLLDDSTPLN
jgi:hypothetical protein